MDNKNHTFKYVQTIIWKNARIELIKTVFVVFVLSKIHSMPSFIHPLLLFLLQYSVIQKK